MRRRLAVIHLLAVFCLAPVAGLAATADFPGPAAAVQSLERQALKELQSRNYSRALALYQQALRLSPQDQMLHCQLGRTYACLGQFSEAEAAFQRAIRLQPDFAPPHAGLGWLYLRQDRLDEAQAELQEALRLQPDLPQAHSLYAALGWVCLRQNRPTEAKKRLQTAIRLKPDLAQAHFLLGAIYLAHNDLPKAREEYEVLRKCDLKLAHQLNLLMERASRGSPLGKAELQLRPELHGED